METWQQDRRAINLIESVVLNLEWMWRPQPTLDYGIDGQIEICDGDKKPTGRLFAVQAKGGSSYFYRRGTDGVLTIRLQRKHLLYWNSYQLPVLVIGHFPAEGRAYWLYVQDHLERNPDLLTAETESTCLEIPDANVFDADAKSLLDVIPDRHNELIATRTKAAKVKALHHLEENIDRLDEAAQLLPQKNLLVAKQVLKWLSQGRHGAGFSQIIDTPSQRLTDQGTLLLLWKLGNLSPKLMLADYVGDILSNRLSIILNPDSSLTVRACQRDGTVVEITSNSYPPHESLVALAVWKRPELSLWVNGQQFGPSPLLAGFDGLGPLLLFGLDVEDQLSADVMQWAPPEEEPGITFLKDGIGHGSRWQFGALWGRALDDPQIAHLSVDPFAMLRRKPKGS